MQQTLLKTLNWKHFLKKQSSQPHSRTNVAEHVLYGRALLDRLADSIASCRAREGHEEKRRQGTLPPRTLQDGEAPCLASCLFPCTPAAARSAVFFCVRMRMSQCGFRGSVEDPGDAMMALFGAS